MAYSFSQLKSLWKQAGGSAALAPIMAAIALAESGGNPKKTNVNADNSVDYGIWQINSVHGYDTSQLVSDPLYNAKAAVSIEHGSGLHAWSSYNNNSYTKYLQGKVSSLGIYSPADFAGVDQGVDFRGKGVIPALDTALVTDVGKTHIVETGNKAWNYVIYRLQTGPYRGHFVYVAENFTPEVHKGEMVQKGQAIGVAPGAYPYTETGFNRSAQGWSAFGDLNGPQPSGQAMKDYIYGILGQGDPVTVASSGATGVTTGGATPSKIASGALGGVSSGIEAFGYQALFVIIGLGLILVGLALVAWTVMGRVGAGGAVGMVQSQMRIRQAGGRIEESQRASMVRESQAGARIEGQTASRNLSRERLNVQRRNLERRSERYVVKDKPVQVVRKKSGNPAGGVPRRDRG